MYIIYSITLISLLALISMLLFRWWEIKSNRISEEHIYSDTSLKTFHYAHKASHVAVQKFRNEGVGMLRISLRYVNIAKSKLVNRSGLERIKIAVSGKRVGIFKSKKDNASSYLKNITEHKDRLREDIKNGKEEIQSD